MAISIKHNKVSLIPDSGDASLVEPSDWNAEHTITGVAASGANTDITSLTGITGAITSPTYVGFDTTYATTLSAGQLGWDGNNTLGLGMAGGNVIQHIGEDQFFYIKASSAITKGQVIMFTGAVGASGVTTGAPATGITDGTYIMGIAAESIALNGFGLVQCFGSLRNVNTSGYADGDILWYDPSVTGGLTKTKPSAPNIKVQMAAVINGGSAGGGSILIRVDSGSQLGGTDSNVQITSPTTGQSLVYDSGTGIWTNSNANVVIGGSVNNSPIGASTASTGKFTTLEATGNTTLGTGSANYLYVTGGATSTPASIFATGSDTNVPLQLNTKGTSAVSFYSGAGTYRQLRIDGANASVNYVQVAGSATGAGVQVSAQGSDTNIPLVLQPKGTGALQAQLTDSTNTGGNTRGQNAVDWQAFRGTPSNVASGSFSVIGGGISNTASNYSSVVAGGNGNQASNFYTSVLGGNVNIASGWTSVITGGGSNTAAGYFNFIGGGFTNSGTAAAAVTTQATTAVTSGSTAVTLSASNANIKQGQWITGTGVANDTYVAAISGTSLTLSKNASGTGTPTLSFYTPHGVVVGGGNNQATGSYSFIGGGGDAGTAANRNAASGDWSAVVGGRANSVVGIGDFIGGGRFNTTTGGAVSDAVICGGNANTASAYASAILGGAVHTATGPYSTILGGVRGTTRGISGYVATPASVSPVAAAIGASQASLLILGIQTTDATATVLTSTGTAAGTTNQVILPNNSAYYFKGSIIAGVTGAGNSKAWSFEGAIKRGATAGSVVFVGTPSVNLVAQDAGASSWTVALTADTTNGGLAITVTGQAATTIRWVAKVETTEMTF